MSPKWMMFFFSTFIAGSILGAISNGTGTLTADQANIINVLLQPDLLIASNTGDINVFTVLTIPWNMIVAMWNTVTFNYNFLNDADGNMTIFRLCCMSFSVGFIWGVVQLVRGTSA